MSKDGDPPGAHPDRYERGDEIARGGMGRVIEAIDRRLGRTVAIKETLDAEVTTRLRFEREVRITARLEHPSIVPVHDAGVWATGEPFYVMRKVSGRPLDQLIAAAGSLDARLTLLPHMSAVVDAMAHAHDRGIVHRDLKPANVLVGEHGETLVIDWGLAKVIGESSPDISVDAGRGGGSDSDGSDGSDGDGRTRVGEVIGTPGFMAPEQALATGVDARTDVFAIGACLYHLLAGTPPFHGGSDTEVLDRTVAESPARLAGVVAGVPPDLAAIVEKAMSLDPARRYVDAAGLRDDLRRFLAGQLVAAHHYSTGQRVRRTLRRYRAVIGVAVLALAVVIVVGVLSLRRIFADRDRIALARTQAVAALARERERADELVVTQAQSVLATNPTLAIATLKQLPPNSPAWDRARPLVAAARAAGIPYGYASGGGDIGRAALGPDNLLVTSGGSEVMVHDLAKRTSKVIAETKNWIAVLKWAGRYVVWRDDRDPAIRLHVVDPATGAERTVTGASPLQAMTSAPDGTIVAVDETGVVTSYDAAGDLAPVPIAIPDDVATGVALSPSGAVLVIQQRRHTVVYRRDRTRTFVPIGGVNGSMLLPKFSPDETRLAALVADDGEQTKKWADLVELDVTGARPVEVGRWKGQFLECEYALDGLYATTAELRLVRLVVGGQVQVVDPSLNPSRVSRMWPMNGGAGVVFMDADNQHLVIQRGPVHSALVPPLSVDMLVTSTTSPYVVALSRSQVVVWNLDEALPRITATDPGGQMTFLDDRTLLVTAGIPSGRPLLEAHDVVTGEVRRTTSIPFSFGLARVSPGHVVSFDRSTRSAVWIDAALNVHSIPIPDPTAALALGAEHIAVATSDGTIDDLDLRTGANHVVTRVPGMNEIAGANGWLAAMGEGGTIWRRAPDGREETLPLIPPPITLVVDDDGEVAVARKTDFVVWPTSGPVRIVTSKLPLMARAMILLPGKRLGVITADEALHVVDLAEGDAVPGLPACGHAIAIADSGGVAAAACPPFLTMADLETGAQWTLPGVDANRIARLSLSPDGESLAGLVSFSPDVGMILTWRVGLPHGSALAAWVNAATNAIAPHGTTIEWK